MSEKIHDYLKVIINLPPVEVCAWAINEFGADKIALASSLGAEDQVLTDILWKLDRRVEVFTLDTGRLPNETYQTIDQTNKKYGQKIHLLFPDGPSVSKMESEMGPNLFYDSVENRKRCCHIRKVEPLQKKLKTLKAWITGLRAEQSVTRTTLQVIEWDETAKIVKINPLIRWTEKQVWDYIKENQVPYNPLHDQGYPSIGCAPCTRAIQPGEDIRAGRWWWEEPEQKECGLHFKDGKLVRKE